MIKNAFKLIGLVLVFAAVILVGLFWKDIEGLWPALGRPPGDIAEIIDENNSLQPGQNSTEFPLKLPDGFKIEIFARNLPGAPRHGL